MAQLNPSIILAGSNPDIMAAFDGGQVAAERGNQIREQNALRNLYQTQGAGLVAGEQGAINALAGINAPLAMDFRRTQQTMQIDQENARLRAAELARSLSADQRAQASEQFGMGAQMIAMAQTPDQFQSIISRPGFAESAGVLGITPDMLTFENRDMLAATALGAAEVMKLREGPKAEAPMTLIGKINADLEAGRISPEDARLELERAKPRNTVVRSLPNGGFEFIEGPGAGQNDRTGGPADPSSAIAMVNSIDGILNDPALESATGVLAWTQALPGTPMYRFGQRVKQLDGQAFLQAFESLKGGGQITEIEGQRATQAIGRLSSAQSAEDYRDALTELRSILSTAAARPQGWVEQQRRIIEGTDILPAETVIAMSPDQIRALGPAGLNRIPLGQLKGLTDEQWDALEALGSGQ